MATTQQQSNVPTYNWIDTIADFLIDIFATLLVIPDMAKADKTSLVEAIRQADLKEHRIIKLQLVELATAFVQGVVDETKFLDDAGDMGFSVDNAKVIAETIKTYPSYDVLLELLRRNKVDKATVLAALRKSGVKEDWIEPVVELTERLPSLQDTILFLVREVFNPELRSSLGLDLEYPTEATDKFKVLGVGEETAKNYWASHWRLPSVQLAFEMFHRKEITEDDLNFIMKASDILPKYREPIVNTAYRPLTRVDVRRMHDMGVLDDAGLTKAYLDLGYSPDNADLMVEWTKLYNQDVDNTAFAEETRNLTRSQITRLYGKSLLTREDALTSLQLIGYPEDVANIILADIDLNLEIQEQDNEIDAVIALFKRKELEYEDAVGQIAALGLTGNALEIELARLGPPPIEEELTLSLSVWNRMLKQGIIKPKPYMEELEELGYDLEDIGNMVESYGVGSTNNNPRPNGRLAITERYDNNEIDYEQWFDLVIESGYTREVAQHFADKLE